MPNEISPTSTGASFAPRISVRAVGAGTLVALASLWVAMAIGGALGLWGIGVIDADAVSQLGTGFAIWGVLSWALVVFVGAWTASTLSGSPEARDGAFHGFVTWASTCVVGGVLGCVWLMSAIDAGFVEMGFYEAIDTSAVLWTIVLAEALAITGSVLGGKAGVRAEARGPDERAPRGLRVPTETPV